jgi:hypothetical protein
MNKEALCEVHMKRCWFVVAAFGLLFLLAPPRISAQESPDAKSSSSPRWYNPARYNPAKLFKRPKSANDQLASDALLEKRLTTQLQTQGVLPGDKNLQDVCSTFRELGECIAVLRLSRTLPVDFTCLKWDVTGVKPNPVGDSCAGPAGGKAMSLDKAVDLLKPDTNVRAETKDALQKARNDIKDASS